MAGPKIAILQGRRNSSVFCSSAPHRIHLIRMSLVEAVRNTPWWWKCRCQNWRALPIARSLNATTRSVLLVCARQHGAGCRRPGDGRPPRHGAHIATA